MKLRPSHKAPTTRPDSAVKNAGFTLIEVMVAMVIFAVGVLALSALQLSAVQTNAQAADMTILNAYGQDKLEELRRMPITGPALEAAANPAAGYQPGDVGLPTDSAGNEHHEHHDIYDVDVIWRITDDNPVPDAKRIEVTVFGRDGRMVAFTTAKGEK